MDEPWFRTLRETTEAVRPTPEALSRVEGGIRRRRQMRSLGATVAAAGLVGVVIAATGALNAGTSPEPAPPIASSAPTAAPSPLFDCPLESRVFGPPPAIADLDRQKQAVHAATQGSWTDFEVRRAEPTALGVVALVSGDLDAARQTLKDMDVKYVYSWDPTAASVGVDAASQVRQVLGWLLEPVIRDVRQAYRGMGGFESLALWKDAGAVLLQWKAPVPEKIEALAGARPDGVRVIVEPTRYSARDIHAATTRVIDAIRAGRVDAEWSSAYGCADGSGLVVGIQPASLGERRAELQRLLAEVAGMPVHVVPEQKPVELAQDR